MAGGGSTELHDSMSTVPIHWWVLFNLFVVVMLALDLGVFHRRIHAVKLREAAAWSMFWVAVSLAFNLGLYLVWPDGMGRYTSSQAALTFFTGYVIEKALSVDNIFVFVILFRYFDVPALYHHRVLFWGVIGAMILRAIFIIAGVAFIERFHWAVYVLGLFLIFTGLKMAFTGGGEVHPERNPILKLARRLLPVTKDYVQARFFTRVDGRLFVTPLFIVLLVVETTDVVFAVDSIPAILGITHNAFIVYTSNMFAVLGLRALYFVLAGMVDLFHYLKYGLSVVLVFVGVKMLLEGWGYELSTGISLGVVAGILAVSIVASVLHRPADDET